MSERIRFHPLKSNYMRTFLFVLAALVLQYLYLKDPIAALSTTSKPFIYEDDTLSIRMEFPGSTEIHVTPDKGEEMKLNIYFLDSRLDFRGYIQYWAVTDLKYFLNDSKAKSTYNFTFYTLQEITLEKFRGYRENWTADFGENQISAVEYWLKVDNNKHALRLSFFTDKSHFPEDLQEIVATVLQTLELDSKSVI